MVAGLGEGGAEITLRNAVSVLVASIIYVALMLVVFKVAGSLTKGWRMGRAQALAQAHPGSTTAAYQERPLNAAPAAAAVGTAIASERVRSTVASLETSTSSHRLLTSTPALTATSAPVPQLALAGPSSARNQLRYLHHRVAGASSTQSREMFR
jgi:hypothetical protein